MIQTLRNIVIEGNTKNGRRFDLFIQSLILLSLISFSLETLPNLDSKTKELLRIFEVISVSIFSIEYLLRVILTKKPLSYIFSFFGIIDLLAILPFYLASGIDLRSIRVFRMFRLFINFHLRERYFRFVLRFSFTLRLRILLEYAFRFLFLFYLFFC